MKMKPWLAALVLLALGCRQAVVEPVASDWQPPLSGQAQVAESEAGMVVSGHPLASRVGAEILAQGGSAIDAAVAVGFALAVVLPRAGNIGGGGFLVYRSAAGDVKALDFRETAPLLSDRDMYLDDSGELTEDSVLGHRASGVPGSVAGLWEMHKSLGRLPWKELVEPAVRLAEGHTLDATRYADIEEAKEKLSLFAASAEQFLPDGAPPAVDDSWSQADLARTLSRIADGGAEEFYSGETADLLVAEMERGGGLIQHQDLLDYRPVWRQPVAVDYRGHTIYTMPPPSSGGITLGEIANILEGFGALPAYGTADLVQLEAEAMRRAFVDRNEFLGDPDFVDIPEELLTSQAHADSWRQGIERGRATPTSELELLALPLSESTETTHYSIVDGEGNAVSITTTLNGSFGSKVTVAGAGFLLNNEMDDFAAAPGKPNLFGLVQGEANAIAPKKRMLSSMTPSIVLDPSGELLMVVGSPGGPTIITTVFQVLSNVVDHQMTLEAAVEAARVHHQGLPDRLYYEAGGLPPGETAKLEQMGYELEERGGTSGNVSAILRVGENWQGVADPRRAGGALGVTAAVADASAAAP